ncbi:hypothetical protein SELMODRAFT_442013 [Selaginella moellendorffii]|uniref:Smr domain-containing protein n=2 Tax=Selaginella moellendorffii TaxID=88036 RepID=D8RQL7_SELML|nr:hypothetical protein SELMODRAFT_442013 [Selaginella moellendorffii]
MLWALPTSKPATTLSPFSTSSTHSHHSHGRFLAKAASSASSLELDNGEENRTSSNTPEETGESSASAKTIPRYTKWTPQFARVDEVLKILQKTGNVEAALESWDKSLSAKNIVTVLNNINRWEKALAFFEWLKARPELYEINRYTYNVMLKILRNGRQLELSEKLVEEMTGRGIQPDNYTFSTLINCAKRCRQPEEALKWFERMKSEGIVPDEVTYNSVIDMYGRVGRVNEAVELYEKLKSVNWKLDTVTYGAIANVYARAGDYQSIIQLVQEMRDSGSSPNAVIMNTLMGTLSKAGKVNQAKKVFNEMRTSGVSPTPVTLSILVEMYTRVGAYDQAFEVYETLKTEGWKCDVAVYNSLMKACVEGGRVEQAEDILKEMKRAGCNPDHLTYRTAMNTYATKGMVDPARRMFDKVVALNGKPDTPLFTVMIRACKLAGEIEQASKIFDEMMESGCCSPDERVSGMLLSCMAMAKNDDERLAILDCLDKFNAPLHELMSAIVRKEEPRSRDEVAEMVEKFISDYPETDSRKPLCNCLIDICSSVGMKHAAHKIFAMGVAVGAYDGLQTNLPSLWRLNLRTLSMPAAECAIEAWVSSLKAAVREGDELPEDLIIETGVGRVRSGQRLNPIVGTLLKKLGAPFTENTEPAGYYCSTGAAVEAWIKARIALEENSAFSL